MDDEIFSRIKAATTSNQAWKNLKQEFLGDKKVITVKLQTLRHEFETVAMKEKEYVQEFLSRVPRSVSQMRTYGENVGNETIVSKMLRSLTKNFDYIVGVIEESKDLCTYTFDQLMSSLQAYEERVSRSYDQSEEKAFQMKGETPENSSGGYHGKGRGRGQGRGRGRGSSTDETRNKKFLCNYCKKPGHISVLVAEAEG